jgi:hypothetical protein
VLDFLLSGDDERLIKNMENRNRRMLKTTFKT